MGRRKLELKRIEDKTSRQVTFSKLRGGLMKKAKQLSVLCDAQVAVVVISSGGRHYHFCSHSSISEVLDRYQCCNAVEGGVSDDLKMKTQLLVNSKMNLQKQEKMLIDENEDLARKVAELQGNSDNGPNRDTVTMQCDNLVNIGIISQLGTLPLLPR